MYQFSRSIYRELAQDVVPARARTSLQQAMQFLRRVRVVHGAARARPALLREARCARCSTTCATSSRSTDQMRVYRMCEKHMAAGHRVRGQPAARGRDLRRQPGVLPREHPQGHRVPARAAAGQQVLPVAQAPRRGLRGRRGLAAYASPSSVHADDPRRGRWRHLHRRRAARPATGWSRQGADHAGRPVRGRDGRRRARRWTRPAPSAGDVERFVHGMTVGTNALLEGRVARTALLATEGFTDLEELGRQARPELYRLCAGHPPPLVPAELRVAVPERTGPDGVLRALDEDALRERARRGSTCEAAAVCLLWGFRHPEHERRVAELAEAALGDVHVSTSHETAGVFREYERCATTIVDAALSPLLRGYLERLTERAGDAGLPEPEVMLSSGGTAGAAHRGPARVLDGAVGPGRRRGRRGARGRAADAPSGSTWAARRATCRWCSAAARRSGSGRERRRPRAGAADGGRAHGRAPAAARSPGATPGGALRVGPRSAGADPGPACYGRGGSEPDRDRRRPRCWAGSTAGSPLAGGVAPRRGRRRAPRVGAARGRARAGPRTRRPPASRAWPAPRWPRRCGW